MRNIIFKFLVSGFEIRLIQLQSQYEAAVPASCIMHLATLLKLSDQRHIVRKTNFYLVSIQSVPSRNLLIDADGFELIKTIISVVINRSNEILYMLPAVLL